MKKNLFKTSILLAVSAMTLTSCVGQRINRGQALLILQMIEANHENEEYSYGNEIGFYGEHRYVSEGADVVDTLDIRLSLEDNYVYQLYTSTKNRTQVVSKTEEWHYLLKSAYYHTYFDYVSLERESNKITDDITEAAREFSTHFSETLVNAVSIIKGFDNPHAFMEKVRDAESSNHYNDRYYSKKNGYIVGYMDLYSDKTRSFLISRETFTYENFFITHYETEMPSNHQIYEVSYSPTANKPAGF